MIRFIESQDNTRESLLAGDDFVIFFFILYLYPLMQMLDLKHEMQGGEAQTGLTPLSIPRHVGV